MTTNSYFYTNLKENDRNKSFLSDIERIANEIKQQIYVVTAPLTDNKYSYDDNDFMILLSSKRKIAFITCKANDEQFDDICEDVVEDIGSISDKYGYRQVIGRPRKWRDLILTKRLKDIGYTEGWFNGEEMTVPSEKKRLLDLLISLFIGSINDVKGYTIDEADNLLDKVKQKIQLFDGQQTRFIYEELETGEKRITIQGLSGTGKTELLLHKLKGLYTSEPNATFCFTCYNKILANSMRKRIPDFFNFMKVEQQIDWERLFCVNAWGSYGNYASGVYRYICEVYELKFYSYREWPSFDKVCKDAIEKIKQVQNGRFAFTYMFIDESQDFDSSFFDLCELVTEKRIYVAGDIFQTIFEEKTSREVQPNFLLSKCYRTDPKTLMFAQAIGMGLFEKKKLWWLDKEQWEQCGYNVAINDDKYTLTREPLRRFEDVDPDFDSLKIVTIEQESLSKKIVQLITNLKGEFPSLSQDDIAIIYLDSEKYIYDSTQNLVRALGINFGYECDIAYETKRQEKDKLLISNKYNVKGLEYPFVICITKKITREPSYRNTVYTMLTRSFIRSYLVILDSQDGGLTEEMLNGGHTIMKDHKMIVTQPSNHEMEEIKAWIKVNKKALSLRDRISEIVSSMGIYDQSQIEKVQDACKNVPPTIKTENLTTLIKTFLQAFDG